MSQAVEHFEFLSYAKHALGIHFRHRPALQVHADLTLVYREGARTRQLSPDVMVLVGDCPVPVGSHNASRTGVVPQFVLEVLSARTSRRDRTVKREIYRRLGVREYWLYDPQGRWLPGAGSCLQAERLRQGRYVPASLASSGWPRSEVLGLELREAESGVRFWDPAGGRFLLTHPETDEARLRAERGQAEERRRRRASQTEAAEERRRRRASQTEAAEERRRRRAFQHSATHERLRRRAAERRVRDLEEELAARRAQDSSSSNCDG